MNDISAALGISQLKRINQFIKRRNKIAKLYNNLLKDIPIKTQKILPYNYSSYHLFIIQFDLKKTKLTYNQIFDLFRNNNYYVNLHYMPLHLSPYFKKLGFRKNDFPNSEEYQKKTLSLPIFYDLKKISVIKIVNLIKKIYKA